MTLRDEIKAAWDRAGEAAQQEQRPDQLQEFAAAVAEFKRALLAPLVPMVDAMQRGIDRHPRLYDVMMVVLRVILAGIVAATIWLMVLIVTR